MKNKEIAEIFERIATILEIKGDNIFKVKAYQKAAENINALAKTSKISKKRIVSRRFPVSARRFKIKLSNISTRAA